MSLLISQGDSTSMAIGRATSAMLLLDYMYVGRRRHCQHILHVFVIAMQTNIILHVCVIATLPMLRRDATTVYLLVASLDDYRLLLCWDATIVMLHVCESPHPVNTHRPSASRGAGVPYALSASRGTSTVCLTYYPQVGVPMCLTYYSQVGVPVCLMYYP